MVGLFHKLGNGFKSMFCIEAISSFDMIFSL